MAHGLGAAARVLRARALFWEQVRGGRRLGAVILKLAAFIAASSAVYGAAMAGWRSPRLSLYVAAKLPLLLLGTTALVSVLNWIVASALGSGLTFRRVIAVTYGAMAAACWILLGLAPVTIFFVWAAAPEGGSPAELRYAHNCLLLMHIVLVAFAGVAGNAALREGLARLSARGCRTGTLYLCWLAAFMFVGCQLSWILRPFVGSPFYPVVFMRPDRLERNFYEFVFGEVLPYVLKGGG
jgi:hypothetical protein